MSSFYSAHRINYLSDALTLSSINNINNKFYMLSCCVTLTSAANTFRNSFSVYAYVEYILNCTMNIQ